jgi:hypothetical protein
MPPKPKWGILGPDLRDFFSPPQQRDDYHNETMPSTKNLIHKRKRTHLPYSTIRDDVVVETPVKYTASGPQNNAATEAAV